MALSFQLVQSPFRFGVEEGVDPKQVPFGTLLTAENVVWKKEGRLEKRQGTASLGTVSNAKRLIVRGRELAATDGSTLYSYAGGSWVSKGRHPELGLEWETALDTTAGVKSADVAYLSNGQVVIAWVIGDPLDVTNAGTLYFQVIERSSGAFVVGPTLVNTGAVRVRIVTDGTTYAILYSRLSGGSYDLRSYVGGTSTSLKTDGPTSSLREGAFDACMIGSGFVIAYALAAGGIRLVRYSLAATPVQQATDTVTSETSTDIVAISIDGASGESLYIAYADNSANRFRIALANASTMAQTVAPANIAAESGTPYVATIAVHRVSSTGAVIAYSFYDIADDEVGMLRSVYCSSMGTLGTASFTSSARLLSRPFTVNSRQYALVGNFTNTADLVTGVDIEGSDVYVADVTVTSVSSAACHRLVGKTDLLTGGAWFEGHVSNVAAVSSTEWVVASPVISETASVVTGWRQGVKLVTATIGASLPADMWRSVQVGPEAVVAGSVLTVYDGQLALPYSFAHPAFIDAGDTTTSGSGGAMTDGTYLYNTVPERRSTVGVLHRGPTAVTQSFTIAGPTSTGRVSLQIVPVNLSMCDQDQVIALYRTAVGGSTLHRITVEPTYLYTQQNLALEGPIGVTDGTADAAIGGTVAIGTRPALYTEGGELDDYQPPALNTLCVYRSRIFGIDGGGTIRYTKSHAANPGVAPGFNPAFRVSIDDKPTALAVLDERLVIFSETGIYYLAGDGPAPNGDGPFEMPNRLQTDVGCTNPRAVVSGPDGIFFECDGELHLLTRGLEVAWIGRSVQDQLAAFPNITSAVLVASKNHVRFTCNAADGLTGIVLVYDYVARQWSTFKYGASLPIADACMHDGAYTFVTTAGAVYKESDATHLDAGSWVTAKIETAWIHAAGPLNYQAVRNFRIDGVSSTAHGLAISVGFDGNTTYQQGPESWAAGVSGVTTPGDSVTANVSIGTRRKCRSIRFKVQDSAPVSLGTGAGAKWSTMGIEVGVKRGLGVLPVAQKG